MLLSRQSLLHGTPRAELHLGFVVDCRVVLQLQHIVDAVVAYPCYGEAVPWSWRLAWAELGRCDIILLAV